MADEWQREFLPQNQRVLEGAGNANSDRALQNTSGNIQSYSDTIAHHSDVTGRDDHLQQFGYKYPPPHLVNAPTLHQQAARFQAKKLRRLQSVGHNSSSARRARSYLKSHKYMEYRARPRRDTGKDGDPVWSDELEDAFQQGEIKLLLDSSRRNNYIANSFQLSKRIPRWVEGNGLKGESHMAETS